MNYQEIVGLWKQGRENWHDYELKVGAVAQRIYNFFCLKLELQDDNKERYLKLLPPTEKDDEKIRTTSWSAPGCVEFQDDGWSTVGLLLLLERSETSWPKNQYRFYLNIRYNGTDWKVKIAEDGKLHNISNEYTEDELNPIWIEFLELIKHQTIDSLNIWLGI